MASREGEFICKGKRVLQKGPRPRERGRPGHGGFRNSPGNLPVHSSAGGNFNNWKRTFSMCLAHVQISLLQRRGCEGGSQGSQPPQVHTALGTELPGRPQQPSVLLAQRPRTPARGLRTQGSPSPSSCEMPSTDLWGILHSCRDLVRSENRLLGTSMVSMLQGW